MACYNTFYGIITPLTVVPLKVVASDNYPFVALVAYFRIKSSSISTSYSDIPVYIPLRPAMSQLGNLLGGPTDMANQLSNHSRGTAMPEIKTKEAPQYNIKASSTSEQVRSFTNNHRSANVISQGSPYYRSKKLNLHL